eukprot:TRINITY_DN7164_c0_g1_i1.p2 TRINITY_DN7164_c0_g1~~TRINITY_DN7164_c0_g1_i1.p2  ORF type:complete len:778 (+),score=264.33 TRINITY_DN7164_c0_g1_i1:61-2394(+)
MAGVEPLGVVRVARRADDGRLRVDVWWGTGGADGWVPELSVATRRAEDWVELAEALQQAYPQRRAPNLTTQHQRKQVTPGVLAEYVAFVLRAEELRCSPFVRMWFEAPHAPVDGLLHRARAAVLREHPPPSEAHRVAPPLRTPTSPVLQAIDAKGVVTDALSGALSTVGLWVPRSVAWSAPSPPFDPRQSPQVAYALSGVAEEGKKARATDASASVQMRSVRALLAAAQKLGAAYTGLGCAQSAHAAALADVAAALRHPISAHPKMFPHKTLARPAPRVAKAAAAFTAAHPLCDCFALAFYDTPRMDAAVEHASTAMAWTEGPHAALPPNLSFSSLQSASRASASSLTALEYSPQEGAVVPLEEAKRAGRPEGSPSSSSTQTAAECSTSASSGGSGGVRRRGSTGPAYPEFTAFTAQRVDIKEMGDTPVPRPAAQQGSASAPLPAAAKVAAAARTAQTPQQRPAPAPCDSLDAAPDTERSQDVWTYLKSAVKGAWHGGDEAAPPDAAAPPPDTALARYERYAASPFAQSAMQGRVVDGDGVVLGGCDARVEASDADGVVVRFSHAPEDRVAFAMDDFLALMAGPSGRHADVDAVRREAHKVGWEYTQLADIATKLPRAELVANGVLAACRDFADTCEDAKDALDRRLAKFTGVGEDDEPTLELAKHATGVLAGLQGGAERIADTHKQGREEVRACLHQAAAQVVEAHHARAASEVRHWEAVLGALDTFASPAAPAAEPQELLQSALGLGWEGLPAEAGAADGPDVDLFGDPLPPPRP